MRHCRTYALVFECKDESRESTSNVLTVMNDVISLISKVTPWVKEMYIDDRYADPVRDRTVEPLK